MKFKKNDFYIIINNTNINGVPDEILILPLGRVMSRKGPFVVDKVSFDEMYRYFKERNLDIVIDYEHQTLEGVQAPAAGWIKDLVYTPEGIKAKVEWTKKAKEYLANKEYRYLSPVVLVRKSDNKAVRLHSVALTNTPAIDGMKAIINNLNFDEGGFEMEFLKQLAKILNLAEDATEEQIIEAVKKLLEAANNKQEQEVVANKEVLELLDLKEDAKLEDVKGKIIALKNPAGYVSVEEFNKLKQQIQKKECDELVQLALSSGKITPAQKEWAETYALKDPTGFKNFIENAPQVVPLEEIANGDGKQKKKQVSSDTMLSINKMLGITDEDIEKYGKDDE
ncbi:phage protease [Caloranaerobacter sp. DY30410]|uniref:phage protease n=1 Tax=Caloranaerobacter sp. DY30410 TaxID=3238305 RepID=UPI003CFFA046